MKLDVVLTNNPVYIGIYHILFNMNGDFLGVGVNSIDVSLEVVYCIFFPYSGSWLHGGTRDQKVRPSSGALMADNMWYAVLLKLF